ncbi:hypothetical protein [Pyxidicoccus xibeiensis]|uniref:hypothetical protein n=1 Tax=Pyxidicoccus xibeiensis TaxID=2906759 RepID=UPI0020A6EAE8|nr:hypothetical protein [Pyxidicoccus xibeiensis]MCP3139444.1 hypothetical protein [Pyxidicoccus xibeiensis]
MSWRIVLVFCLLSLLSPQAVAQEARPAGKSVLLLIPEDTALPAMATLVANLRSSLWEAQGGSITLDVESLDLGWARGPAYTHALYTWYLAKYRERRPDALIAFRSDAIQLALQLRRELWPDVPTGSPALAALNNYSVWVIYANAAGQLFYNVLSGVNSWQTQLQLIPSNKDSGTNLLSNAPSAAVYNGQIYVAYKAHGHNNIWYNASSDGNSWGPQTQASNGGLNGSPSLVAFNNSLYLFHTGDSNDGKLGCTVMSSNGTWCNDTQIYQDTSNSAVLTAANIGPSATVFNGRIYCFINAKNSALGYVIIDSSMTFGTNNHPTVPLFTVYTSTGATAIQTTSPGAVAYNGALYSFVNSPSNSLDYVSSTNPPTAPDTSGVGWGSLQQAGFGGATGNGGGSVLGVVVEQTAAIAEPFIGAYLVPGNLANTAFIEQGANGPKWVKPTWTLVTDV